MFEAQCSELILANLLLNNMLLYTQVTLDKSISKSCSTMLLLHPLAPPKHLSSSSTSMCYWCMLQMGRICIV